MYPKKKLFRELYAGYWQNEHVNNDKYLIYEACLTFLLSIPGVELVTGWSSL